ncbi:DUF935 domain-containing protein [Candidatus Magnetaquicoccus inordinatus]|uniref:DUF935 domain-containing protein n=1 Tax=Candidatus Magnetaquicoccus inordinatus TaxID=2496818 RepID=UPI001D0ED9B5|nr:DUF935 family protein [Candidatus Magnetaquicoccus inordinatus]
MDGKLKKEIAPIGGNIHWPAVAGILRPHDETLLQEGGSLGLWIYDKLEQDDAVASDLQKRKLAVIGRPWAVEPASEAAPDQKAAELVERLLQKLPFNKICLGLLDAILKGFSVGEIIWETDGKFIVPRKILMRDQRRFYFNERSELLLVSWNNFYPGDTVPAKKFIVHRYGAKDDNPYGVGLGSILFWPVYFKQNGARFWSTFLDRFGNPALIGRLPNGTEEERARFLAILRDFSQETNIVLPEGYEIELLEAAKAGGGTLSHEAFCKYNDNRITRTILGDGEANSGRGGGALAAAAIIRNEVRLELVQADADLLADTLNESLLTWITDFNFPNAIPPHIKWDVALPEDLKARAERDKIIHDMGFKPDLEYINRTYDDAWSERPTTTLSAQESATGGTVAPTATGDQPGAFAETAPSSKLQDPQTVVDAAIPPDDLLQKALAAIVQPILDRLQDGATPQEIMGWLAATYPQMDTSQMTELLARAFFAAETWGRLNGQGSD